MSKIKVIIPAYNEEKKPSGMSLIFPPAFRVIVINNNSTDNTIQVAKNAGATVLSENRKAMAMLV
jgi:glycosyltransferase involved in cell wall biosynthesis